MTLSSYGRLIDTVVYIEDLLHEQAARQRTKEFWIIDGFGRLESMERRFREADKIVFVDFPLWRHYWWCTKRQFTSLWRPREELPAGCDEATIAYTLELYQILWRVHTKIRPKLLSIFDDEAIRNKVVRVTSLVEWNDVKNRGFD